MANIIADVAKLLDVELVEYFKIKGYGNRQFALCRDELHCSNSDVNTSEILGNLVEGKNEIIKEIL